MDATNVMYMKLTGIMENATTDRILLVRLNPSKKSNVDKFIKTNYVQEYITSLGELTHVDNEESQLSHVIDKRRL